MRNSLMRATAALALLGLAGPAAAQEPSAIRQMIEMQLNSRATEPRPPAVPGLEAGMLVMPRGQAAPAHGAPGQGAPLPGLGAQPAPPPVAGSPRPAP